MSAPEACKLPLSFDVALMQQELDAIPAQAWTDHFNRQDYAGDWSILALYSPTGDSTFIHPMHTDAFELRPTPILELCPYLRQVVESFQCPKLAVRLMSLHPGSLIKEHTDPGLSLVEGVVRLHLPIRTHPDVVFQVNQQPVIMQPGECWYIDFTLPHQIRNNSPAPRVHLVLDCVLTPWLRAMFPGS